MKLKVDVSYPEGEVRTEVWRVTKEGGSKKRELTPVSTMDDLATEVAYQSFNRFIIRAFKMWAHKKPAGSTLGYGISLKVIKIENESSGNSSKMNSLMNKDAFIDSDDDDDDDDDVSANNTTENNDSESDSESDSDSDDDDDDAAANTKNTKAKATTKGK